MRPSLRICSLLALLALGCGRLRYEQRQCPSGMIEVAPDAGSPMFCIEIAEREALPWNDGRAICEGMGRRLCTEPEWADACVIAGPSLQTMTDGWEWTVEIVADMEARKRGDGSCDAISSHIISDPYPYRCCAGR